MVGKKLFVSIPAHGSDERVRVSAIWQINNTQYKNNKWRSKYKFDKTSNYSFAVKNSFHSVKSSSAKEFMSYESKKKFYILQIHKSPDGSVIIYTSSAGDKNHNPGYLKSYVSNLLSKEFNEKLALAEFSTLTQHVDAPNTADVRAHVKKKRQFGAFAGKFKVSSEFFEPMSQDELNSWGHE